MAVKKQKSELERLVESQQKEINQLKQAINILNRQMRAVNNTAVQTKHQTRRIAEDVRGISNKLRSG